MAIEAQSWLKKKGWLLNNKNYTNKKPTDTILSASLSFKLPAEASTAIQSVAFLICDQADKDVFSSVTDKVIDKVIDKLKNPIENLNKSIMSTKNFLNATTQQQAS